VQRALFSTTRRELDTGGGSILHSALYRIQELEYQAYTCRSLSVIYVTYTCLHIDAVHHTPEGQHRLKDRCKPPQVKSAQAPRASTPLSAAQATAPAAIFTNSRRRFTIPCFIFAIFHAHPCLSRNNGMLISHHCWTAGLGTIATHAVITSSEARGICFSLPISPLRLRCPTKVRRVLTKFPNGGGAARSVLNYAA
jgi:hypothetical protein